MLVVEGNGLFNCTIGDGVTVSEIFSNDPCSWLVFLAQIFSIMGARLGVAAS